MPIEVVDNGKDNKLEVDEAILAKYNGKIILEGDNNRLSIAGPVLGLGAFIHLNGGADVEIGSHINAFNLFIYAAKGGVLRIGQRVGFNGAVRLLLHEPAQLLIGDGALFGSDVDVTVSDMHSIVDAETRQRLNPARDVKIGERVWIGQRCLVLKGVEIGAGTAIGAGSVVTHAIPANCVAAGNPARVIRRNATWDFRLL